jgi:alkylation response protein AidB-like acyl-CoA dehydrogenase
MGELSPKQHKLVEQARAFARELSCQLQEEAGKIEQARRLFAAFAKKGYHALLIPKKYGGKGLDYLSTGIIYETLSFEIPGTLSGPLTSVHSASMIESACQNAFHGQCLKAIAKDHAPAGFCLTEETAGSDITAISTTALRQGDGYVVNGTKSIVINHAIARIFLVFAAYPTGSGRAALNAFVMDADAQGITLSEPYDTLGFASGVMGSVSFNNVRIHKDCLLGEQGSGYLLFMETLDKGRPLVAACCVGETSRALDLIVRYSKDRVQFGKPLSTFQGVTFTLADLATRAHAARLIYRDALERIDAGKPFTMEASMAKLFASEVLFDCASFGMDMLGHKTITAKSEITRIYHDARLMKAIDGTANVQRMVIASQL